MIAAWMFSVLVFTALLAATAWCAEASLRAIRRPARWVWLVACSAAIAWPVIVPIARRSATVSIAPATISMVPGMNIRAPHTVTSIVTSNANRIGDSLLLLWAVASTIGFIRLFLGWSTIARIRKTSAAQILDGVPVLVNDTTGPAVIGLVRPSVLVPRSVLALDQPLRRIVLRHEEEHRRAHDPWLIIGSAVAVAIVPWNLPLWWMTRRLHLALELDCDARVVASDVDPTLYSRLLLLVAQSRSGAVVAPMLAAHNSHLERRITAMFPTRSNARTRVTLGALGAVLAGIAACNSRIGDISSPAPAVAVRDADTPANTPYFEYQVDKQATQVPGVGGIKYPASLRSADVQGQVLAEFVIDENGKYVVGSFKVRKSDHELFTQAVAEALPGLSFRAAELKGRRVSQVVQQPFTFSLSSPAATQRTTGAAVIDHRVMRASTEGSRGRPDSVVMPIRAGDLVSAPGARISQSPAAARAVGGDIPYFEYQVSKAATQIPGTGNLRYPTEMRAASVDGEVIAQFVVDATGVYEPGSFKAIKSTNEQFADAVRLALPNMRFTPAEYQGRQVRQVIQQPFTFKVSQ